LGGNLNVKVFTKCLYLKTVNRPSCVEKPKMIKVYCYTGKELDLLETDGSMKET
jgi:hypothetical protein